jgi:hypothetical protein
MPASPKKKKDGRKNSLLLRDLKSKGRGVQTAAS